MSSLPISIPRASNADITTTSESDMNKGGVNRKSKAKFFNGKGRGCSFLFYFIDVMDVDEDGMDAIVRHGGQSDKT